MVLGLQLQILVFKNIYQLPSGVVFNNSSGTYDANSNSVSWSDTGIIENRDCEYSGASDYWIEVTFPSSTFGGNATPPLLETENNVSFEGYPFGEAVIPTNRLFNTDTLLHGFGLPNAEGVLRKTSFTPSHGARDFTHAGEEALFTMEVTSRSASSSPYSFKVIDPLPCLDYTPNAITQYESPGLLDPNCSNPAFRPTNFIEIALFEEYLNIPDKQNFIDNNPTIPISFEDTNGNLDTLHIPYERSTGNSIRYKMLWADIEAQLVVGANISKVTWNSEDSGILVGLTTANNRTVAYLRLDGSIAEDNPPTYPMEEQYRVRNTAHYYINDGSGETLIGSPSADVIVLDKRPTLEPSKTVSENTGLIVLNLRLRAGDLADNDTLILTDLLPFGYTFNRESQQYIEFEFSERWYWLNTPSNSTPYSELDDISILNYIDVSVIDNYNNTGRQLVRAAILPPPVPNVWDGFSTARFSFYVNEVPMTFSAINSMEGFPTNPITVSNLQCQANFGSSPTAPLTSDPNDLDGDGITVNEGYCSDTDQVNPSSTIVNIKSFKSVRGEVTLQMLEGLLIFRLTFKI